MTTPLELGAIRAAGKPAVARALAAIETAGGIARHAALLDACVAEPGGHVLGLTGPPGVGKSTLTNALVRHVRARGETLGVIAVDPSSRVTRGALLGDRTRLKTDPDDRGIFVRSMAARDRLGGLSDHAVGAVALMQAVYDRVIVESVGIGQSEADVATVADTVVLCIQPGSGDSLQFMKAGVMEIPDVVVVTKADTGAPARRAAADVEGALSLAVRAADALVPPVLTVSSTAGTGLDALLEAVERHRAWTTDPVRADRLRAARFRHWVADAVKVGFGTAGLALVDLDRALEAAAGPFGAVAAETAALARRLEMGR
ncbi:ArgK/MeaB family GTPase [Oharaeibacter diazotrophicus]|uniref:LAO/AO transport system kinase n=1 Tax=Oharaeibacter diazotrophicus TaxID=1920512 RepID=A0A4R6RM11_9HYPH|nr:ATP/GTP-binding protein [Oharaeibacter diazotrophicus]TDP87027.1 LAO/AO transport system kinase [Oharaeibacter diazotrophicus]BBE71030.1 putative GTPase/MT1543 [Pleomorphomonas sp. SM30]GLS77780.1 ArgK protein [Oharaeibacter diazotrophicus]